MQQNSTALKLELMENLNVVKPDNDEFLQSEIISWKS